MKFRAESLRQASEQERFAHRDRHATFLRVSIDGYVTQAKGITEKRAVLAELQADDLLLAAWTGSCSTDVYVLDTSQSARFGVHADQGSTRLDLKAAGRKPTHKALTPAYTIRRNALKRRKRYADDGCGVSNRKNMRDDLKTRDIARLLRVSEETVRQYARDGRIPFHTTPGGHRRFDANAVRAALGTERPHGPATLSIGPPGLADIPAGASSINFSASAPTMPMATEVTALAGAERAELLPTPPAANRVHGSLMRWAQPARVPLAAPH